MTALHTAQNETIGA